MSSRADTDTARLRRLRRIGHRHGLTVLAAKKHEIKKGGGYMLSLEDDRKVILGDQPSPYSATLEEIEAHLERLEQEG